MDVKVKDCRTCKWGWEDERLGIPFCHNYGCKDWDLWCLKSCELREDNDNGCSNIKSKDKI